MKLAKLLQSFVIICAFSNLLLAQTAPNLENGWKPYGSYDGTRLDTVNVMNGNLMVHAPLIPDAPQRGSLNVSNTLYASSKDWQAICTNVSGGISCSWQKGGAGVIILPAPGLSVHRTRDNTFIAGTNDPTSIAYGYTVVTPDQSTHQMHNGDATDLSGYHIALSVPDGYGVPLHVSVTDRSGNQYDGDFKSGKCSKAPTTFMISSPGPVQPIVDDVTTGDQYCPETAFASLVTDSNGNQVNLHGPGNPNPSIDTLGRLPGLTSASAAPDFHDCVSPYPFYIAMMYHYQDPNGAARDVKLCSAEVPIHTAFGQTANPAVFEAISSTNPNDTSGLHFRPIVTAVLADGTKWTFDYDNYGEITSIGLPTGGSITYTWKTINYLGCNDGSPSHFSRAVDTRTLNDGQGHSYQWTYHWGTIAGGSLTNVVTDPLGNDTAHVFSDLSLQIGTLPYCKFYETSTIQYQGAQSANKPIQRVDTTYSAANIEVSTDDFSPRNVFATDVLTTVYPSGKVKKIHKDPDTGLGAGLPIFGNVKKELDYDWGQGTPGPLLRETDTTYKWETNADYLSARLLDLPASVVIKNGSGCALSETDYTYDEPSYLTGTTVSTQHVAAPNPAPVRGNLSTVKKWLAPTSSCNPTGGTAVTSHTNWYDTGEPYQKIDPLGHTTTLSYDPAYVGGYVTQTCSPQTGSVSHCVSGTYDFITGALTSLSNENATSQASGVTQGDAAHTSNFTYDYMFRLTSAQAPPDPGNGGTSAQTSFTFSAPNAFPVNVQRTKSITTALTDSATSFFDGLGRAYQTQHVLPGGTVTVDTHFDLAGHPDTVSNPYFSTADPTYGATTNLYDALDRVYQTTKQDGSISKVAYSVPTTIAVNGDCVQTSDEAGKQRGACSDALGRLVEVDEPSGTPVQVNYSATLQTDGNFVLENAAGTGIWFTGTYGTNASSIYMQDDGNLVLYIFKWQAGTYAAPSPGPFPAASCSIGSYLMVNQRLNANQCIASPHGQYLLYMASDGNFYIYDLAHNTGTWGPGTYGHPGAYAMLQTDGNFVVYDANGVGIWSSGTYGTNADRLNMEDDGRIIIYKSAWNSGTSDGQFYGTAIAHPGCDVGNSGLGQTGVLGTGSCLVSPNGRFELLMQGDGNLVIYDRSVTPNKAWWSTGTGISAADPGFAMRTLYSYDALGNLLRVDQKGSAPNDSTQWRTRTFTYDSLSRLLTANNPESGTITYSYDLDGNLLQKTSPAPNQTGTATQTVSYCYDELHRVTGKGYGAQSCPLSTPVVSYVYDSGTNAKGHLTSLTDQAGTASYTYDILGRLSAETRTLTGANNASIPKNLSYEYNLDGSLYKLHYPSGNVVTYEPGAAGLTLSAKDSGNNINYVTSATYGPDSGLAGFVSGYSTSFAGITNAFTYNKRLQPVNMSANAPGQTVFSIGYDFHVGNGTSGADNGNVFGITNYKDQNRNQTFTYDLLNRLISAQNAGTNCAATVIGGKSEYWGNSYGYDAWGNLLQKSVTKCGAENLIVTADAHNWIHASGTDYQYDAAGNMTFNATPPAQTYTYDQENRLTGAAGYAYTYDADGNRVVKSNGSTGTLYWYMTPGIVGESDLSGNLTDEYVFFDGERVARKSTNGVFYYFSDHLKTASVITDASGNIKSESDFYPWGGELQFVNNDSNHYKFTGKERDSETQLDYFGARFYSNGLGRWVSADWSATPIPVPYASLVNPQTLNLYSYVLNLPTSATDLDGHFIPQHCATCEAPPPTTAPPSSAPPSPAPPPPTPAPQPPPPVTGGISFSAILTGAAIVFIPAMIWPDALPDGTVGQSDTDERAQSEQAKSEREEQNGGVDPQEPKTSTAGGQQGTGGSGKSGKGTKDRGKDFSQEGTVDQLRSIQKDQRIKNIESTKKSEQSVDNTNKKIKTSQDIEQDQD
jgi:RHS repeat-associated protein